MEIMSKESDYIKKILTEEPICNAGTCVNEVEINGEWVRYDGMSASSIEQAKAFYSHWHYIGAGSKTRHNGHEFDHEQECFFFNREKFSKTESVNETLVNESEKPTTTKTLSLSKGARPTD
jgi:hypothetical protein